MRVHHLAGSTHLKILSRVPGQNSVPLIVCRGEKWTSQLTEFPVIALNFRGVYRQIECVGRDLGNLEQFPALEVEYIPK